MKVELLIGKECFNRGLHRYHSKFAFGNATTVDWVHCMEEESGVSLQAMANGWLKRSGMVGWANTCYRRT